MQKKKVWIFLVLLSTLVLFPMNYKEVDAATLVTYQTHIENIGWQNFVSDGVTSGTSGKGLRLEGLKMRLPNVSGSIEYSTHVQNIGWQSFAKDGALAGTSGKALRLEGVKIRLSGDIAKNYNVYYRVHVQNIGWQNWKSNGEMAGTSGQSLRLEALEAKLIAKNGSAPSSGSTTGTRIVDFAKQQLGIPYVYGGSTRSGFDCSGLTQYVYRNVRNINIGRITTDQEKAGTTISVDQAQPGDLVFWGNKGASYHVAIYIGNAQYIHAPVPGETVKIGSFTYYKPNFAVRI